MTAEQPLLAARDVVVRLVRRNILQGVTLSLSSGVVVGLVGPSGAGKSTLARVLMGLLACDAGEVLFDGAEISSLPDAGRRRWRREVQMVFQDPREALNPRLPVLELVREPLQVHRLGSRRQQEDRVCEVLEIAGLKPVSVYLHRHAAQLSGGERQRVALARSLAAGAKLLILDEPVSALDAVLRGGVLATLSDLRRRQGIGVLLVAHDLAMVRQFCDRVAVLSGGVIVEEGPPEDLMASPSHPTTRELVDAAAFLAVPRVVDRPG